MRLPPLSQTPGVSYVMPVLNEEAYLAEAVRTILAQDYSGEKELVLALAPSRDRSAQIARELADADPRVRVVDNPQREIPIGLNLAIAASRYPILVRVDAHSQLTSDYTRRGIETLRATGSMNVGGIMQAAGRTPTQRAIASAYNSPYGLGGGAYHGDGTPGPVESAYLGIFRREAIESVGGYDAGIRRGEDWELNLRIRRAGGAVWFDPSLGVTYWPRASFRDLARQFYATGAWRAVLVKRYASETPWRFYAPGSLVIGLLASLVIAICQVSGAAASAWWSLVHVIPASYLAAILFATTRLPKLSGLRDRMLGMLALVTMHLSWGSGFLTGIIGFARRTVDRSRVE